MVVQIDLNDWNALKKENAALKKQLEELRFQVGANLETVRWLIQKTHELLFEQNSYEVKNEPKRVCKNGKC